VVDATAQRIFPLHRAWLQVVPGEVLSCNGCHTPPSSQNTLPGLSSFSHGRNGLFTAAWSGATSTSPFPGTLGSYSPCIGDTMAEVLAGWDCGNLPYEAATLSTNVAFTDPWFGGGPGNESILLSYDDPSFTTPLPTSQVCLQVWTATCRIEIDYPTHIQPLWDKDRGANTCTTCHSGATPAGNLNLADGASATDANQDESYQQLLYPLEVTTTNPSTGQTTQSLARPQEFISGDALDSRFFTFFVTGGAHAGLLSPVELRLLTEWVDIGAQYYNNPFNAPTG